jgi:segregation and condensation protein B
MYPDYLKNNVIENENLVEIPSHNSISKNPFEKVELRYAILENLI